MHFSDSDRKSLLLNRFVQAVTANHVQFTPEFKLRALRLYEKGIRPSDIFLQLGIDPLLFLTGYPKKCLSRWKRILEKDGEKGLKGGQRGRGATGRPKKSLKTEKDLKGEQRGRGATGRPKKSLKTEKDLLERIAFLEAENDFLKKLKALKEVAADKKGSR